MVGLDATWGQVGHGYIVNGHIALWSLVLGKGMGLGVKLVQIPHGPACPSPMSLQLSGDAGDRQPAVPTVTREQPLLPRCPERGRLPGSTVRSGALGLPVPSAGRAG